MATLADEVQVHVAQRGQEAVGVADCERAVRAVGDLPLVGERARGAFLDGYYEAVDARLLPPGQDATGKLLSVFELEKAVYELRYELNNRPDWVGIPVAGIVRLLEDDER